MDPVPVIVHGTQIELGSGVTLVGDESVPFQRFDIVLSDTTAVVINRPEIVLAGNVSLIGGGTVPPHT
jgi:hypothetical protein